LRFLGGMFINAALILALFVCRSFLPFSFTPFIIAVVIALTAGSFIYFGGKTIKKQDHS
jgi:hypothetical protein